MLSISIIIASPAILCLIFYEGHQFQKFKLIRNLIIAIVTRNILILISRRVIFLEEMTNTTDTIMSRNEWACKMLAVFEKTATNLVFACMLLEGIFLHQLLTNVFGSRRQIIPSMLVYYIVVFGKIYRIPFHVSQLDLFMKRCKHNFRAIMGCCNGCCRR